MQPAKKKQTEPEVVEEEIIELVTMADAIESRGSYRIKYECLCCGEKAELDIPKGSWTCVKGTIYDNIEKCHYDYPRCKTCGNIPRDAQSYTVYKEWLEKFHPTRTKD